jgi:hypothetical protein
MIITLYILLLVSFVAIAILLKRNTELSNELTSLQFERFISDTKKDFEERGPSEYNTNEAETKGFLQ